MKPVTKAILLAGGEGVRLRPLTLDHPKPMVRVLGKPLIQHVWEVLPEQVSEVLLISGYKREQILDFIGDKFLNRKVIHIHQKEKLGTGHAARLCRPFFEEGERFLLLCADDLHDAESIGRLLRHPLGVLVKRVSDPRRFGVVVFDQSGRVVAIVEKPENPPSPFAAVGAYVLDTGVLEKEAPLQPNGEYYLTDMISATLRERPFFAEESSFWHPIGYPEDIISAEKILFDRAH